MTTLKPFLVQAWHLLEPLIPGALGAAVGQAWEKGISLKQRLVQWGVGLICAVYVAPALGHVFQWGQPIVNAVGFVLGTLAFKAVEPLRDAAIKGGVSALQSLPEVFRSWAKKPGAAPVPPKDGDT